MTLFCLLHSRSCAFQDLDVQNGCVRSFLRFDFSVHISVFRHSERAEIPLLNVDIGRLGGG